MKGYYSGAYALAFKKSRERLNSSKTADISEASLCNYDPIHSIFYIKSFDHDFEVRLPAGEGFFADSDRSPPMSWSLILLNYLSSAKNIPLSGKWVTYRQLPHGNVFFPSIKINVLDVLSNYFSTAEDEIIKERLNSLGFSVVGKTHADLTAIGKFAPRIPIMIQFWDGEESIPPSFQILFDAVAAYHMHMEDLVAVCGVLRDLLMAK